MRHRVELGHEHFCADAGVQHIAKCLHWHAFVVIYGGGVFFGDGSGGIDTAKRGGWRRATAEAARAHDLEGGYILIFNDSFSIVRYVIYILINITDICLLEIFNSKLKLKLKLKAKAKCGF